MRHRRAHHRAAQPRDAAVGRRRVDELAREIDELDREHPQRTARLGAGAVDGGARHEFLQCGAEQGGTRRRAVRRLATAQQRLGVRLGGVHQHAPHLAREAKLSAAGGPAAHRHGSGEPLGRRRVKDAEEHGGAAQREHAGRGGGGRLVGKKVGDEEGRDGGREGEQRQ